MRNMLALLAAAALTVIGAGWYLGWYNVSSAPTDQGTRGINIELNTPKIDADLQKGSAKLHDALRKRNASEDSAPSGGQEPSEKTTSTPVVPKP